MSTFFDFVYRYVHVDFHDSGQNFEAKPCSLVICAPAEAQADQCVCAFQDALRMLLSTWDPMEPTTTAVEERTWLSKGDTPLHAESKIGSPSILEPGCVVPGGGTFEVLLNQALLHYGSSSGLTTISKLLAEGLLSVAQQLYSHSPRSFLQIRSRLLNSIQTYSQTFSPLCKQDKKGNIPAEREQSMLSLREDDAVFIFNLGLESVCCKYQLLLAVLQCVSSLLQVDTVMHTHTDLHTITRRLANISWEETENEAEDWRLCPVWRWKL